MKRPLGALAVLTLIGSAGFVVALAQGQVEPAEPTLPADAGGDRAAPSDGSAPRDSTPPNRTTAADASNPRDTEAPALDSSPDAPPDAAPPASGEPWLVPQQIVKARCVTAICLNVNDQNGWLGIEPLLELPIGEQFTRNSGGLANYVNNTELKVSFSAGLRVWVLQDWVSLSVYISQPITPKDSTIRLAGSSYEYPGTYVRRPYPGLALGLLFDTLWIGLDRDELRNGSDGSTNTNPQFPPNSVVAGVWTWTVAIQPFTTFRTGIGTALSKSPTPASSK